MGSFNNWKRKLPLKRCKLRGIFIRYIDGLKSNKEYEIKFIVDSSYQLSSNYEMIESCHPARGMVNIYIIGGKRS